MTDKTKKRLILTAAIGLFLLILPLTAGAETVRHGTCGANIAWTLSDAGVLTITGSGPMTDYLNYSEVPWCESRDAMRSVYIGDGVTSIGKSAFYGCSYITAVRVPDSVKSVGEDAFFACAALTEITLPDGVPSIGYETFSYCTSLTSFTFPKGMTYIGDYAFDCCTSLTCIYVPDSLARVGSSAFSNCTKLSEIHLSSAASWVSIRYENLYGHPGCNGPCRLFLGDEELTNAVIPEGVTGICDYAFYNCAGLKSVSIPNTVTGIGSCAFSGCTGLNGISLPSGVTSIGSFAFESCTGLTGVTIPASVTSIGRNAFFLCENLDRVYFCVQDEKTAISFGDSLFYTYPEVYCYMFTAPDTWCLEHGVEAVYLDGIDLDAIRTVALPEDCRILCGETATLTASVFPDLKEPITWSSSDPDVATVLNGVVTAVSPGRAVIMAEVENASDSVVVEVYLTATGFELNESEVWLVAKSKLQLQIASMEPYGAGAAFTWISSDTGLATVDENGLVTTHMTGDVTITAVTETGVTRSCRLHLCYPVTDIALSLASDTLMIGQRAQITANVTMRTQTCVNRLVMFSSSDEGVVTVDENGMMRGVSPGSAIVAATADNGVLAIAEVQVTDGEVLILPAGLEKIEKEAFMNTDCQAVIIPDGCEEIGCRAFAGCAALLYVRIPASVAYIADDAFEGCDGVFLDRIGE